MAVGKRSSGPNLYQQLTTILLTLVLAARLTHAFNLFDSVDASGEEEDQKTNEWDDDEYDDESYYEEDDDDDDDYDTDYEDEWKDPIKNMTSIESDVLTFLADYLSNVHTLLWNVETSKDKRAATKELEDTWSLVKRDAVVVATAAKVLPGDVDAVISCVANAHEEAQHELQSLQETLFECYIKETVKLDPSSASIEDDDDNDSEPVYGEAHEFLDLALNIMSATGLDDAIAYVKIAMENPHGLTSLVHHAEMLQRRGLRRRATIQRCVDINKADAYKRSDAAREVMAQCLLLLEATPPGVDPKDEL